MKNIAIIDADLISNKYHRFPNLVCMKLSTYFKQLGNQVVLKTDYNNLLEYDKVYISKAFTDSYIDLNTLTLPNVEYGGTGFFYDKANPLPIEIEHTKPDYTLYNQWISTKIETGNPISQFKDYQLYSLGFLTRGCFRKCDFCVNKRYNKSFVASPLIEFLDTSEVQRNKIMLLDDNFLSNGNWKKLLLELIDTGLYFNFKQGLDLRLITEEKAKLFQKANYYSSFIFAFDNIEDRPIIEEKLKIWKDYNSYKRTMLYVFCGFDRKNIWNQIFWYQDIIDTFERVKILADYECLPYIMRYNRYEESPYRGIYITLARWCNQPWFFATHTFREFCYKSGGISIKYLEDFEAKYPKIAKQYFDFKIKHLA